MTPCAWPRLERPGPDACPICCQRLGAGRRCPNELCASPRRRVGRIHALAYQSGPLRQAINEYKYRKVMAWSAVFGRLLLAWLDECLAADPPDLIVANPSFAGAGGQLFAHTEAVLDAAALAAAGRAETRPQWRFDTADPRAIVKTRATFRSADMQAWSKRVSTIDVRSALRVPDRTRTAERYVLVYDDVCTTGGQLDAVADCLLDDGGARRVEGVVLARAAWRGRARQVSQES
jgi:predicted amidophosphoribosyltransferase